MPAFRPLFAATRTRNGYTNHVNSTALLLHKTSPLVCSPTPSHHRALASLAPALHPTLPFIHLSRNMNRPKSVATSTSSQKRKRSTVSYYVVKRGWKPDIYMNWSDVQEQIKGFPNSYQQRFDTLAEAEAFLASDGVPKPKTPTDGQVRFYAVRGGPGQGIYTSWDEAKPHIHGQKGVKHHKFNTREEAESFVNNEVGTASASASNGPGSTTSIKGEFDSEPSLADVRNGSKIGDGAKRKKTARGPIAIINGTYEPGEGPLPPDAEDGFDRRLMLNPLTGQIEYKTEEQLNRTMRQPTGNFTGPLVIYTDGSTLGNGRVGAVGGIGVYFGPQDPRNLSEPLPLQPKPTNQRAELTAIKRAVELAPIDKEVLIYSDSNYAIKCVTEWFQRWEKNGKWLTSGGKPVENRDLVEPVIARIREREMAGARTKFQWIKGHADNAGNTAADSLARGGSRQATLIANGMR
ncbi:ribonuclease H-like protein [Aaosphaeria arxii CBS 175.79]|uniref:ribonuclease H n=1 Tax=Aaosphaeria arxii CBS 175.79 TaxID=1450172 RepID=A0A6A5XU68_9PLEO|nr:ribonuclease H-like protein [Aaosphaeria arxii CBS 175.79]KAF2016466.1 ribonuclease H-like protein [Aaosphaeria arxii CBS 175.79]